MGYPLYHQIRSRPVRQTTMPVAKVAIPPPEANAWWWHPNRVGVPSGPPAFCRQLKAFDPDLAVTWNLYRQQWAIWMRAPAFRQPTCWGWKLLFLVEPRALDERVLARLYAASTQRWGNGRRYFEHIEAEMARDREKAAATRQDDVGATARDYFDYMKIKNYGSGSKFVTHHA